MTTARSDAAPGADGMDGDALKVKYAEERAKRLRPDGNDQYLEVAGRLGHYLDDPYTEAVDRNPVTDHVTVAVIGAGFAGLVTGARLKEAGIDDVRIVDKGGDVGGNWYWNRYPGAQCDTASFVYMPLLEETGHMPTEKYAHAPEILEHCRRIATSFGLYAKALFHSEITGLAWDEASSRWTVRTNRGDAFTAQFVTMGTGPLHVPKLPGIPGIESFAGHSFHTSRWDYDYTGGDPETAANLKAWYRQLCKRPCFHDEYLDAYNEPDTHLVDTDGKGVERITESGRTIATVVRHALDHGCDQVEVTAEAEQDWIELLLTGGGRMIGSPDCTPGYYNNEGRDPGPAASLYVGYPKGATAYFAYLDEWRSSGDYEGLAFR